MLNRWREVERETTSVHRADVRYRQAGGLAQRFLNRRAQRVGLAAVRTTHAIGVMRMFNALARSGTCAWGTYIFGPGSSLSAPSRLSATTPMIWRSARRRTRACRPSR